MIHKHLQMSYWQYCRVTLRGTLKTSTAAVSVPVKECVSVLHMNMELQCTWDLKEHDNDNDNLLLRYYESGELQEKPKLEA